MKMIAKVMISFTQLHDRIKCMYVPTRAGLADSAYAVSCGYALMHLGDVHMHLYFLNPHDFYAVSCGYAHIKPICSHMFTQSASSVFGSL